MASLPVKDYSKLPLACPIDGLALSYSEGSLSCQNSHCFDIAKHGYVNLLSVQHKKSKDPGDSKEMVVARGDFLNSGAYRSFSLDLNAILIEHVPAAKELCILDAGCGEGYFFTSFYNALKISQSQLEINAIGLDISKWCIQAAAKRNSEITWLVGTNARPPLLEKSVDIIVCTLGFAHFEGFKKVLKPGGKLIISEAGPKHLLELREIIYPNVKIKPEKNVGLPASHGFRLVQTKQIEEQGLQVGQQHLRNLMLMTPHFFRVDEAARQEVSDLESLTLGVDVEVSVYELHGQLSD